MKDSVSTKSLCKHRQLRNVPQKFNEAERPWETFGDPASVAQSGDKIVGNKFRQEKENQKGLMDYSEVRRWLLRKPSLKLTRQTQKNFWECNKKLTYTLWRIMCGPTCVHHAERKVEAGFDVGSMSKSCLCHLGLSSPNWGRHPGLESSALHFLLCQKKWVKDRSIKHKDSLNSYGEPCVLIFRGPFALHFLSFCR